MLTHTLTFHQPTCEEITKQRSENQLLKKMIAARETICYGDRVIMFTPAVKQKKTASPFWKFMGSVIKRVIKKHQGNRLNTFPIQPKDSLFYGAVTRNGIQELFTQVTFSGDSVRDE